MQYREVESQFVKELIKGTSWKNEPRRQYIDNLIKLEKFILEGPKDFGSGMYYGALKQKYRSEWETLYKELKPEQYKRLKKKERLEKETSQKELQKLRKELRVQEEHLKREWLKIGGTE